MGLGRTILLAVALAGVLATVADAAIMWTAAGTFTTGVTPPPVQFVAGAESTNTRYVNNYALSANHSWFTGTLKGKAGSDLTVKNVTRVTNTIGSAQTVTFTAAQVTNANVQTFTWTVKNGSTTIGTFSYTASSPSLTFTLPAGQTFNLDEKLKLAQGSGNNNADVAFSLHLKVT